MLTSIGLHEKAKQKSVELELQSATCVRMCGKNDATCYRLHIDLNYEDIEHVVRYLQTCLYHMGDLQYEVSSDE